MSEHTQFFIADHPPTVATVNSATAVTDLRDVHERVMYRAEATTDPLPRVLLASVAEAIREAFNGWRYLPERHVPLVKWLADMDGYWKTTMGHGHPMQLIDPGQRRLARWLGDDDDPAQSAAMIEYGVPSPAPLLDEGGRLRRTVWDPERGPVRGWFPNEPTWTNGAPGPAFPPLRDPVMLAVWSDIFGAAAKRMPTHRGRRLARDWARTRDAAAAPAAAFWQVWSERTNRALAEAWTARTPPTVDVRTHRRGPAQTRTTNPKGIASWH